MNMNHLIRIVIIEDNPYVREGWQTFIDMENDMCVLACYESVEDALKSKELNQTDIIIMDIDLPGMSGIEGVKHIIKLDIDPKSHYAWTGGAQKILDKGRVSRYNKKFSNLRSKK